MCYRLHLVSFLAAALLAPSKLQADEPVARSFVVDNKAALAKLLAKAQAGDAEAQYQVGRAYSEGKEVGKDETVALQWFLKAAQRDHAKAQVSLGSIYSHGFGVQQDWSESIRWFRKAAFQGDRVAMHNLGLDFEHAHGVPRDFEEAAHWYRLGAELGQPRCQYNLGLLYESGRGVPQSNFEACVLFTLASGHDNPVHIFGAAKAKEVVAHRDRLAEKLGAAQKARLELAVKKFHMRIAVHPRQFGSPGGGIGATRGWYIWHRFDPDTWEAEVSHDPPQEMYKVRVLPWATTYRLLNYGTRPEQLLSGERVNIFFNPDERHSRGCVVHFQDELCQMKGHGHAWEIRKLEGKAFSAQAMAGDKRLEEMPRDFVIGKACATWQAGRRRDAGTWSVGDRVYLRWCLRESRREVMLIADEASLEILTKQEAERLRTETNRLGMMGRLQSIDGTAVHFMIFAGHWSQAGALQQGQVIRLSRSSQGFAPTGDTIAAKVAVRKNRGTYGSGVSDVMLELMKAEDARKLRPWLTHDTIQLLHE
jgi:TPR repeat protein